MRNQPFIVRVLIFAAIYTAIATIAEVVLAGYRNQTYHFDTDRTIRYAAIGLMVATATLLFFRFRRPKI